jgi:hypothetical protein
LKCTEALEAFTDIVTFRWRLYPKNVRRTLDFFVREMLTAEAFEQIINEKNLKFELSLRVKMLWPAIRNGKDLVSNYRKARKNFIYSVLRAVKLDAYLYRSQGQDNQPRKDPLSPFLEYLGIQTDKQLQNNQYIENEFIYNLTDTIDEQLKDESEYEYDDVDLALKRNTLANILNQAIRETTELMEAGFDITDPSVVTPLGWTANKYPEIAGQCNQAITKIAELQRQNPEWQNTEIAASDEW